MDEGAKPLNSSKSEEIIIHCNSNKPEEGIKEKGFRALTTSYVSRKTVHGAVIVLLCVTLITMATAWTVMQREELPGCKAGSTGSLCPRGWVGYLNKCYYFSDEEADWFASQHNCSSFNASLSEIETKLELKFLLRYKGSIYHWIGLSKDASKPWTWANGKAFNDRFPIDEGGDCAYLSDNAIMSSWCKTKKNWICSKTDLYVQGDEHDSNVMQL
ncbi:C-type lectin domain family 2 member D-like [Varanus komodoensis]|uniref:C-type lectin domain family 2 member D-like n=1 Tax=Varanus komodoensis TaxID=61221 RepID=UPI001CF7C2AA|nr:C-type lectin domain family 2 member D-like [Varanus komodoensis]